jgi:hypothetical protein
MNERQRDLFLYLWAERRKPGQAAIALRGAIIGALGGVVFALFMLSQIDTSAPGYTGLSVIIPLIEKGGMLLGLSVAAFGLIGFLGANRVFAAQESQYQALISAGARVPTQKPVIQAADRGPAIAVGIAVAVIAGFILFVAITLG